MAPPLSRWGEEGFSSRSTRPRHRAVAPTPPECPAASARCDEPCCLRLSTVGLGLRGLCMVSGPPLRSLSLRPGDSLTLLPRAWSMGFRVSVSLHPAIQVTGLWLLPRRGCLPLNTSAFSGRTVDPHFHGTRRRVRKAARELLRMGRVGRGEHGLTDVGREGWFRTISLWAVFRLDSRTFENPALGSSWSEGSWPVPCGGREGPSWCPCSSSRGFCDRFPRGLTGAGPSATFGPPWPAVPRSGSHGGPDMVHASDPATPGSVGGSSSA